MPEARDGIEHLTINRLRYGADLGMGRQIQGLFAIGRERQGGIDIESEGRKAGTLAGSGLIIRTGFPGVADTGTARHKGIPPRVACDNHRGSA